MKQRSWSATVSASRSPAVTTTTGIVAPLFAASAAATRSWTGVGAMTPSAAELAEATSRRMPGSVRTTSSTPRKSHC